MSGEKRPEVITLCGSTKFKEQFLEVQRKLTLDRVIVLSCGLFAHADNELITEEQKKMLDELHFRKIDLSDGIYVIDVQGYVGESTRGEIGYARKNGKFICYYSKEVGGRER